LHERRWQGRRESNFRVVYNACAKAS
jgi:hypothetical protein